MRFARCTERENVQIFFSSYSRLFSFPAQFSPTPAGAILPLRDAKGKHTDGACVGEPAAAVFGRIRSLDWGSREVTSRNGTKGLRSAECFVVLRQGWRRAHERSDKVME